MELDWYQNKLSANAVLTPTSSFRWMSPNGADSERQRFSKWLSILNLMQDRGLLRGYSSGEDYSPPGSNTSSPKQARGGQCRRSLSGGAVRCPGDSTLSSPSLSPSSSSKSHICFGCVLHSHAE